jgi:hypothetical protein
VVEMLLLCLVAGVMVLVRLVVVCVMKLGFYRMRKKKKEEKGVFVGRWWVEVREEVGGGEDL